MFCTKCGYQIKDGYKFCPKCGAPAYVEKEKVESETKAQEEDVENNNSRKEPEIKTDAKVKSTTSSRKSSESSTPKQKYVPNPFMAIELEIEDVKRGAEKGNEKAMRLQSFRYEMGIGTEIDMEKYNELKELDAAIFDKEWISLFYYSKELATPYIATKG